jgi:hypothetical protein
MAEKHMATAFQQSHIHPQAFKDSPLTAWQPHHMYFYTLLPSAFTHLHRCSSGIQNLNSIQCCISMAKARKSTSLLSLRFAGVPAVSHPDVIAAISRGITSPEGLCCIYPALWP